MKRQHNFHLKDYAVALATKVLLILMIVLTGASNTAQQQQQLQNHQTTRNTNNNDENTDITDSIFLHETSFSMMATDEMMMDNLTSSSSLSSSSSLLLSSLLSSSSQTSSLTSSSSSSSSSSLSSSSTISMLPVNAQLVASTASATSSITTTTTTTTTTAATTGEFIKSFSLVTHHQIDDGDDKRLGGSSEFNLGATTTFGEDGVVNANATFRTEIKGELVENDVTQVATTQRPFLVPTFPEFRHRITHSRPYQSKHHHEHHWGPFFEEPLNATTGALQVGVHLGTEAFLNCRVGMLRDKTVMWVRKTTDKVSLLTVGNEPYSGDPRIGVKFQYPNNWRLHVNPIQKEDAGLYMCQVSTHPPKVFATNVTVLSPAIVIVDEQGHEVQDRYYKVGSLIELTCQVAITFLDTLPTMLPGQHPFLPPMQPRPQNTSAFNATMESLQSQFAAGFNTKIDYYHQKLIWRKDNASLDKDGYLNLSSTPQWRISRLTIPHADRTHSGIYSCSILNTTAVVHVQILNGETPAAVQHNSSMKSNIFSSIFLLGFCFMFKVLNISGLMVITVC